MGTGMPWPPLRCHTWRRCRLPSFLVLLMLFLLLLMVLLSLSLLLGVAGSSAVIAIIVIAVIALVLFRRSVAHDFTGVMLSFA